MKIKESKKAEIIVKTKDLIESLNVFGDKLNEYIELMKKDFPDPLDVKDFPELKELENEFNDIFKNKIATNLNI